MKSRQLVLLVTSENFPVRARFVLEMVMCRIQSGRVLPLLVYMVPGDTQLLFPRPLLDHHEVEVDVSKSWHEGPFQPAQETCTGHYAVKLLNEK